MDHIWWVALVESLAVHRVFYISHLRAVRLAVVAEIKAHCRVILTIPSAVVVIFVGRARTLKKDSTFQAHVELFTVVGVRSYISWIGVENLAGVARVNAEPFGGSIDRVTLWDRLSWLEILPRGA